MVVAFQQHGHYQSRAEAWSDKMLSSHSPPARRPESADDSVNLVMSPQFLSAEFRTSGTRRNFLISSSLAVLIGTTTLSTVAIANAAETVGLDPDCTDRNCLGVWDGLLADCPHDGVGGLTSTFGGAGCTSSQDDTPGIFSEPWDYSESSSSPTDWQAQMRLLRPSIELVSSKRGDKCEVLLQDGRYLRVRFEDKRTNEQSIGEFYFTPDDTTVQFRIGSVDPSLTAFGSQRNIDRAEAIRKELRYTKIPVLRNRKRSLFFVESDLDTFGPGSAALGPPAEMKSSDIDGRNQDVNNRGTGRLSDNVDPKLKIDLLQQFPVVPPPSSSSTFKY